MGDLRPGYGRFQVTASGQLLAFYYVAGTDASGQPIAEHRIVEIGSDGMASKPVAVQFEKPLPSFFTATQRAGCPPADVLDLFGNYGGAMRYARIRLVEHAQ